jgi:hypothetical protein
MRGDKHVAFEWRAACRRQIKQSCKQVHGRYVLGALQRSAALHDAMHRAACSSCTYLRRTPKLLLLVLAHPTYTHATALRAQMIRIILLDLSRNPPVWCCTAVLPRCPAAAGHGSLPTPDATPGLQLQQQQQQQRQLKSAYSS